MRQANAPIIKKYVMRVAVNQTNGNLVTAYFTGPTRLSGESGF